MGSVVGHEQPCMFGGPGGASPPGRLPGSEDTDVVRRLYVVVSAGVDEARRGGALDTVPGPCALPAHYWWSFIQLARVFAAVPGFDACFLADKTCQGLIRDAVAGTSAAVRPGAVAGGKAPSGKAAAESLAAGKPPQFLTGPADALLPPVLRALVSMSRNGKCVSTAAAACVEAGVLDGILLLLSKAQDVKPRDPVRLAQVQDKDALEAQRLIELKQEEAKRLARAAASKGEGEGGPWAKGTGYGYDGDDGGADLEINEAAKERQRMRRELSATAFEAASALLHASKPEEGKAVPNYICGSLLRSLQASCVPKLIRAMSHQGEPDIREEPAVFRGMAHLVQALAGCRGCAAALEPMDAIYTEDKGEKLDDAATGGTDALASSSRAVIADAEEGILASMKRLARTCKQALEMIDLEDESAAAVAAGAPEEAAAAGGKSKAVAADPGDKSKAVAACPGDKSKAVAADPGDKSKAVAADPGDKSKAVAACPGLKSRQPREVAVMRSIMSTADRVEEAVKQHREYLAMKQKLPAGGVPRLCSPASGAGAPAAAPCPGAAMKALKKLYAERMADLSLCSSMKGLAGSGHKYTATMQSQGEYKPSVAQRVLTEVRGMRSGLPNSWASSIVVRYDKRRPYVMRAFIGGVEDTPYDSAALVFDILAKKDYPARPPECNVVSTHGGRMRLNPNLYADGKVCLSLLGTWAGGGKAEGWTKQSTMQQVLVSIQGLILVPEPAFNEPSVEQSRGTPSGDRINRYEDNGGYEHIRERSIQCGMIDMLQKPYKGFEDVIKAHFQIKGPYILQSIDKWIEEAKTSTNKSHRETLVRMRGEVKAELDKIGIDPEAGRLWAAYTGEGKKEESGAGPARGGAVDGEKKGG